MNLEKVVQLRLLIKDLPPFISDDKYWFQPVVIGNLNNQLKNLKIVCELITDELEWDGAPTLQDCIDRINFGSICNLWMYDNEVLGWHWTNSFCVTDDWKSEYQKLESNEIYIGGAFLSRKNKPSPKSAYYFYRKAFEYSLLKENKDTMYLYCDDWNRASAQLSYRCGFKKYNFLKEK